MSRSLLDTNIISHVTKPVPSEALVAWMTEQSDEDLFISALTAAEIRRGILEKPPARNAESWNAGFPVQMAPKRCSRPSAPVRRKGRLGLGAADGRWYGERTAPQPARHDHRRSR